MEIKFDKSLYTNTATIVNELHEDLVIEELISSDSKPINPTKIIECVTTKAFSVKEVYDEYGGFVSVSINDEFIIDCLRCGINIVKRCLPIISLFKAAIRAAKQILKDEKVERGTIVNKWAPEYEYGVIKKDYLPYNDVIVSVKRIKGSDRWRMISAVYPTTPDALLYISTEAKNKILDDINKKINDDLARGHYELIRSFDDINKLEKFVENMQKID